MAYLAPKSIVVSVPSTLTFRSLTFCEQNVFFCGLLTHEQHLTVGASNGRLECSLWGRNWIIKYYL